MLEQWPDSDIPPWPPPPALSASGGVSGLLLRGVRRRHSFLLALVMRRIGRRPLHLRFLGLYHSFLICWPGASLCLGDIVLAARVFDLAYRLVRRALVALLLVFVDVLATLLLGLRGFGALLLVLSHIAVLSLSVNERQGAAVPARRWLPGAWPGWAACKAAKSGNDGLYVALLMLATGRGWCGLPGAFPLSQITSACLDRALPGRINPRALVRPGPFSGGTLRSIFGLLSTTSRGSSCGRRWLRDRGAPACKRLGAYALKARRLLPPPSALSWPR